MRPEVPLRACFMDYKNIAFQCVVDWVELQFTTAAPTNATEVRKALNTTAFVHALDEGPGRAARTFKFRLQDPHSWRAVRELLEALSAAKPLAAAPQVTAIEVSLDCYARHPSAYGQLPAMTAHLYRSCTHFVSENRRFSSRGPGGVEGIRNRPQLERMFAADRVLEVGNTRENERQRFYFKTKDEGNSLPQHCHRARYEITLSGCALPFSSLDDAQSYSFQKLARYFKFRRQPPTSQSHAQIARSHAPQYGERAERRLADRSRRLYSPSTVADVALNRLTYEALRNLTGRMQRSRSSKKAHGSAPVKWADFAGKSASLPSAPSEEEQQETILVPKDYVDVAGEQDGCPLRPACCPCVRPEQHADCDAEDNDDNSGGSWLCPKPLADCYLRNK